MGDYSDLCEMYGGNAGDPDSLDELLEKINAESDEKDLEWFLENEEKGHYDILMEQLNSIDIILELEVPGNAQFSLLVMLHAHVVSAIEGYLAGVFIHLVTNSESLTRKLVETDPEFLRRSFTLKEIYEKKSALKVIVATYLKNLIFHNLTKIKPMYTAVLGYEFTDVSWLFNAVTIRHHCVHRAGYDKEGKKVEISKETINDLLGDVTDLSNEIEASIEKNGF